MKDQKLVSIAFATGVSQEQFCWCYCDVRGDCKISVSYSQFYLAGGWVLLYHRIQGVMIQSNQYNIVHSVSSLK